jgi:Sigma-70 region 2
VYRFAMRMCQNKQDACDVLQDTLLAMARSVGELRRASRLSTWLYASRRAAGSSLYTAPERPLHAGPLLGRNRLSSYQVNMMITFTLEGCPRSAEAPAPTTPRIRRRSTHLSRARVGRWCPEGVAAGRRKLDGERRAGGTSDVTTDGAGAEAAEGRDVTMTGRMTKVQLAVELSVKPKPLPPDFRASSRTRRSPLKTGSMSSLRVRSGGSCPVQVRGGHSCLPRATPSRPALSRRGRSVRLRLRVRD